MGNVERSKQIQQERIEPIRSSSKRGFSLEVILHFFAGGSLISAEVVDELFIPDVSVVSVDRLVISDEIFSLYIVVVAISAMKE